MYDLIEYSKNYSKTSSNLWNYYKDEISDDTNDNNGPNKNIIKLKSFRYKTIITRNNYHVNEDDGDYDTKRSAQKKLRLLYH